MNDQTFRGLVRVAKSQVRLLKRRVAKTVDFQGIAVKVDRPQGHVQRGKDAQGNSWERTYKVDYGYITGTQGGDGEASTSTWARAQARRSPTGFTSGSPLANLTSTS